MPSSSIPPASMARFPLPVTITMLFCLALLTAAGATTTTTAELAPVPSPAAAAAWLGVAERLDVEGSQRCWETLMQIKSCTGEIVLFFLEGEAYLGSGCCRAVRAIEQQCWAADAMLSVIGFTPQEGDMLKGFCDAGDDDGQGQQQQQHGASPAPSPRSAADDGDAAVARESFAFAGRKQGPVHGR